MDPVLTYILVLGFAVLFGSAGVMKFRHQAAFRDVLMGYRLLPASILFVTSLFVPLLEIGIACGLLVAPLRSQSALAGAVVLLVYAGAIGLNVKRGNVSLDCGCHMGSGAQQVSWGLVWRNLCLAALSSILILPIAIRPLGWQDFIFVGLGVLMVIVLYGTTENLVANHSREREIRT